MSLSTIFDVAEGNRGSKGRVSLSATHFAELQELADDHEFTSVTPLGKTGAVEIGAEELCLLCGVIPQEEEAAETPKKTAGRNKKASKLQGGAGPKSDSSDE